MKCPNCGSSAQPKVISTSENDKFFKRHWKCGCGKRFTETFKKVK